jgi:mono/diheme cytochrome c family protein
MKKTLIIAGCTVMVVTMVSCGGPRRDPGRAYMPDMAYSTAYETYAPSQERLDSAKTGAHYSGLPVPGTIARGDLMAYTMKNDSLGYAGSGQIQNPLAIESIDMKEAERLYLVNCGICHGAKLDGNGPLFNNGSGPYTAKPATLVGDPAIEKLSAGTIYHVATYGKGQMGSYASQMSSRQRWMVSAFIKSKQGGAVADTMKTVAPADTAGTATPAVAAAH